MPPKITDTNVTAQNPEQLAALEAQAKADAEAAEEKPLDMSLDARMARAKDTLAEAIDAQNQINRIVAEKTKELDELIIEQTGSADNNPMSEIQFYLTSQQRKREQKAEQRNRELAQGIDAAELIRKLDGRAPVDQRPPLRKVHPIVAQAVKTNAVA